MQLKFKQQYSFIFPVHNEEKILRAQIKNFIAFLQNKKIRNYEILLIENGSTDRTGVYLKELQQQFANILVWHLKKASFGLAIKHGLLLARGRYILIQDIDGINYDFLAVALKNRSYDLLVGSKNLQRELDQRPWRDRIRTRILSYLIDKILGYKGTDTHGIKLIRNSWQLKQAIYRCVTKYEFFDTELLLRLTRDYHYALSEIPIAIRELRPSRYVYLRRFCLCLVDTWRVGLYLFFRPQQYYLKQQIKKMQINADDYGLSMEANQAIIGFYQAQSLQRISVLINLLTPQDRRVLKRMHIPAERLCLHFNLLRGKPLAHPKKVSSLIDKQGNFYSLFQFVLRLLLHQINETEVAYELKQQIQSMRHLTPHFQYIDSEQHMHTLAPIFQIVVMVAQQEQLKIRSLQSTRSYLRLRLVRFCGWNFLRMITMPFYFPKKMKTSKLLWYETMILHPGSNYD